MRKILLASAAVLGTASGAWAQTSTPTPPQGFQSQGQIALPWLAGPGANNNNNLMGTAAPGAAAVPAPGTVVIRLGGRVYTQIDADYSNISSIGPGQLGTYATNRLTGLPASGTAAASGTVVAGGSTASYKMNPVGIGAFFRLYPGVDGVSSNGIRYGAGVELRENFEGGNSFTVNSNGSTIPSITSTATAGSATSASGTSSGQTIYVRRAFVYLGSDQTGIVRIGGADGLIGLYDASGTFTVGSWDGGIGGLNDAGMQATLPSNFLLSEFFLSGSGIEYANTKVVYMTPQFAGFDFGLQYDPSMGNAFTNSVTSDAYAVGTCTAASANCVNDISGNDGTRMINRFVFGGRYNGTFAGVNLQGYGTYTLSGRESIPGGGVQASPAQINAAAGNLHYDGQGFFNGGLQVNYLGFSLGADTTWGRMNPGNDGLIPTGAVATRGVIGTLSYAIGPFSIGAGASVLDWQGTAQMVGTSQRHETAADFGGSYKLAPGITLAAEYQYEVKHQSDVNFVTGNYGTQVGANQYNTIKAQGFTFATIISW
jgi:hypothetical protein